MKHLIEFPLESEGCVIVEVDTEVGAELGEERASRPGEIAERAKQTFDAALETVGPTASVLIKKLRAAIAPPNEIKIEFGIKLSAKLGALVASSDAEANFKVTLSWTERPSS
jgi:hypothetical protein